MAPLPHATDEQAARAIAHVSCVLLAAKNGNQHNENMVVLMDKATAMFQRIGKLEEALSGCLHFDDAFIRHGTLGNALRQWRAEAEALLAENLFQETENVFRTEALPPLTQPTNAEGA